MTRIARWSIAAVESVANLPNFNRWNQGKRVVGSERVTSRRLAAALGLLLAAAAGVGVWLLVRDSSPSTSTAATTTTSTVTPLGPVAATPATLLTYVKALGRPIYWAGPLPGYTYEFTETSSGNVYVRYLPRGVRVGDKRAAFRVIGTYPYTGALKALQAVAKSGGTKLSGGGLLVESAGNSKSVHIAYPGSDYEIEIYDPRPGRARTLALSGKLTPVQ